MAAAAATIITRAIFDPKGCFPSSTRKIVDYFDGLELDREPDKQTDAHISAKADMFVLRYDFRLALQEQILASLQKGQIFSEGRGKGSARRYRVNKRPYLLFALDSHTRTFPLEVKRAFGENRLIAPVKKMTMALHPEKNEVFLYDPGSDRGWRVHCTSDPSKITYELVQEEKTSGALAREYGINTGISRS